jgi:hypothetical protein
MISPKQQPEITKQAADSTKNNLDSAILQV